MRFAPYRKAILGADAGILSAQQKGLSVLSRDRCGVEALKQFQAVSESR
jgi:hypothetical protein